MTQLAPHRDLIVVGASAGGLDAALTLVAGLPLGLRAAICVVIHQDASARSELPRLFSNRGALPARHAIHGEKIEEGHIYVAPPDNHLGVRQGYLHVVRGPKENGHRPSVDTLFRTASVAYGPRVIGVVLSGYLDCGTAGLLSIKARGGVAVVQSPEDARVPEMPASAISHVAVDHVAPVADIPSLLVREVGEPPARATGAVPSAIEQLEGSELGGPVGVVCPLCQGHMTMSNVGNFPNFRCHVGHSFSLESLALEQAEEVERALWAAARALEEGAEVASRLAATSPSKMAERFEERVVAYRGYVRVLRDILLSPRRMSQIDVEEAAQHAANGTR